VTALWPGNRGVHECRRDLEPLSCGFTIFPLFFSPNFFGSTRLREKLGSIVIQFSELCYEKNSSANCAIKNGMGVMAAESFSTGEAVRITGVSFRNIDYWARTKFIAPSVAEARGTGTERRYSFTDLLALRVARELREAGVSTQSLRRVVDFLRTRKAPTHPLAECRLVVTGDDVQVATTPDRIMSVLRAPGQTAFAFIFDLARTVDEMKQEIAAVGRKPPVPASVVSLNRQRSSKRVS